MRGHCNSRWNIYFQKDKNPYVEQIRRKGNLSTLLVGMQVIVDFMKNT